MIDEDVIRGLFETYSDAGVGDWLITWLAYPRRRDRMEGRMRSVGKGREFDGREAWAQILKRQADEHAKELGLR